MLLENADVLEVLQKQCPSLVGQIGLQTLSNIVHGLNDVLELHDASPQLLDACKAVIKRGCSCHSTADKDWHAPEHLMTAACPIPIVKAAIAKAERNRP